MTDTFLKRKVDAKLQAKTDKASKAIGRKANHKKWVDFLFPIYHGTLKVKDSGRDKRIYDVIA